MSCNESVEFQWTYPSNQYYYVSQKQQQQQYEPSPPPQPQEQPQQHLSPQQQYYYQHSHHNHLLTPSALQHLGCDSYQFQHPHQQYQQPHVPSQHHISQLGFYHPQQQDHHEQPATCRLQELTPGLGHSVALPSLSSLLLLSSSSSSSPPSSSRNTSSDRSKVARDSPVNDPRWRSQGRGRSTADGPAAQTGEPSENCRDDFVLPESKSITGHENLRPSDSTGGAPNSQLLQSSSPPTAPPIESPTLSPTSSSLVKTSATSIAASSADMMGAGDYSKLIQSMTRRELEEYAMSYIRKTDYLERKLDAAIGERRRWEEERAYRSRQMLESGAAQEMQMREAVEAIQRKLTAESAIRQELEETLAKMRNLCRLATDRLKLGVAQREALMADITALRRESEQLRLSIDETKLLNAHLQERCDNLEYELDRNEFRYHARTAQQQFVLRGCGSLPQPQPPLTAAPTSQSSVHPPLAAAGLLEEPAPPATLTCPDPIASTRCVTGCGASA